MLKNIRHKYKGVFISNGRVPYFGVTVPMSYLKCNLSTLETVHMDTRCDHAAARTLNSTQAKW
jgi:hypothetical protein